MKVQVEKNCGNYIANVLRQVALTQLTVVRPIAIQVGSVCNVLSAGKDIQEDMTTIISNLTSLKFETNSDDSIFKVSCTVDGQLKASDLNRSNLKVCDAPDDTVILTTLGVSIPVTIYFRQGTGVATTNENTLYLESYGISTNDLVVFVSRHCMINKFSYTIEQHIDTKDIIDLSIESYTDDSDEVILEKVKTKLISIINGIQA